jgi:hypothetical protein
MLIDIANRCGYALTLSLSPLLGLIKLSKFMNQGKPGIESDYVQFDYGYDPE